MKAAISSFNFPQLPSETCVCVKYSSWNDLGIAAKPEMKKEKSDLFGFRGLGSPSCAASALCLEFLLLSDIRFCSPLLSDFAISFSSWLLQPGVNGFPMANICSFTPHAISLAMRGWPLHAAPPPPSPSRPIQTSTARRWKMLLLVLIQFDICYYGSSEAYTKVALEIQQTGTVSFAPPFPFLARGLFSYFLSVTCGGFSAQRGQG